MMKTLFFVAVLSFLMTLIPNKSNFPSEIMIPIIVSLMTKYTLGDWDKGYAWTIKDIYFWSSILLVSYAVVLLKHTFLNIR